MSPNTLECPHCGDNYRPEVMIQCDNCGYAVCSSCFEHDDDMCHRCTYYTCAECSREYHRDDMIYCIRCEHDICSNCFGERFCLDCEQILINEKINAVTKGTRYTELNQEIKEWLFTKFTSSTIIEMEPTEMKDAFREWLIESGRNIDNENPSLGTVLYVVE